MRTNWSFSNIRIFKTINTLVAQISIQKNQLEIR